MINYYTLLNSTVSETLVDDVLNETWTQEDCDLCGIVEAELTISVRGEHYVELLDNSTISGGSIKSFGSVVFAKKAHANKFIKLVNKQFNTVDDSTEVERLLSKYSKLKDDLLRYTDEFHDAMLYDIQGYRCEMSDGWEFDNNEVNKLKKQVVTFELILKGFKNINYIYG